MNEGWEKFYNGKWWIYCAIVVAIAILALILTSQGYDSRTDGRDPCNLSDITITRESQIIGNTTLVVLKFAIQPTTADLHVYEGYNYSNAFPYNISCGGKVSLPTRQIEFDLYKYMGKAFNCSYSLKGIHNQIPEGYAQYRKNENYHLYQRFCGIINIAPATTATTTTTTTTSTTEIITTTTTIATTTTSPIDIAPSTTETSTTLQAQQTSETDDNTTIVVLGVIFFVLLYVIFKIRAQRGEKK